MVDGQAGPCMALVHGMGVCCYWGDLAMTTYNRQPARQRGVEVEMEWRWGGVEWVHAPVSCSIGVLHACTGGGDGFMTRGPEFYILVSCPQMKLRFTSC